MVRLTDRPGMTLDVYCGRKTTTLVGFLHTFHFLIAKWKKESHGYQNRTVIRSDSTVLIAVRSV